VAESSSAGRKAHLGGFSASSAEKQLAFLGCQPAPSVFWRLPSRHMLKLKKLYLSATFF